MQQLTITDPVIVHAQKLADQLNEEIVIIPNSHGGFNAMPLYVVGEDGYSSAVALVSPGSRKPMMIDHHKPNWFILIVLFSFLAALCFLAK